MRGPVIYGETHFTGGGLCAGEKANSLDSTRRHWQSLRPCCSDLVRHQPRIANPTTRPMWLAASRSLGYRLSTWQCRKEGTINTTSMCSTHKGEGISIINISKPAQPKTVGVIPWSDPAVFGRMNLSGD